MASWCGIPRHAARWRDSSRSRSSRSALLAALRMMTPGAGSAPALASASVTIAVRRSRSASLPIRRETFTPGASGVRIRRGPLKRSRVLSGTALPGSGRLATWAAMVWPAFTPPGWRRNPSPAAPRSQKAPRPFGRMRVRRAARISPGVGRFVLANGTRTKSSNWPSIISAARMPSDAPASMAITLPFMSAHRPRAEASQPRPAAGP